VRATRKHVNFVQVMFDCFACLLACLSNQVKMKFWIESSLTPFKHLTINQTKRTSLRHNTHSASFWVSICFSNFLFAQFGNGDDDDESSFNFKSSCVCVSECKCK